MMFEGLLTGMKSLCHWLNFKNNSYKRLKNSEIYLIYENIDETADSNNTENREYCNDYTDKIELTIQDIERQKYFQDNFTCNNVYMKEIKDAMRYIGHVQLFVQKIIEIPIQTFEVRSIKLETADVLDEQVNIERQNVIYPTIKSLSRNISDVNNNNGFELCVGDGWLNENREWFWVRKKMSEADDHVEDSIISLSSNSSYEKSEGITIIDVASVEDTHPIIGEEIQIDLSCDDDIDNLFRFIRDEYATSIKSSFLISKIDNDSSIDIDQKSKYHSALSLISNMNFSWEDTRKTDSDLTSKSHYYDACEYQ